MPKQLSVQHYPKDSSLYHYAYIDLVIGGGFISGLLPFHKLLYQVIDEDREVSIYDSKAFRDGWLSHTGILNYTQTVNYMTQNGWQPDGQVYCSVMRDYLPRYRKLKT